MAPEIFPIPIETAASYFEPGPLSLWLYDCVEKRDGILIQQSVVSTIMKTLLNFEFFSRFSKFIFEKVVVHKSNFKKSITAFDLVWISLKIKTFYELFSGVLGFFINCPRPLPEWVWACFDNRTAKNFCALRLSENPRPSTN